MLFIHPLLAAFLLQCQNALPMQLRKRSVWSVLRFEKDGVCNSRGKGWWQEQLRAHIFDPQAGGRECILGTEGDL